MELLGNKELLNQKKTAFLASNTIPTDMVLPCYDWAKRVSRENNCVMSGFSSHLEKQVLRFLLKGTCPIILILARQMYKQIPTELQPHIDSGRLLIVSTSSAVRQSKATSLARNRYICETADEIIFVGVTESSSLFPLSQQFHDKTIALK